MQSIFSQKTSFCLINRNRKKKKQKGVFTILSAFLFVIFSTVGLGSLFITQIYLKISGYKKNMILLDCAAENGIKDGFHKFQTSLSTIPSILLLDDNEYQNLLSDSHQSGESIIDKWMGANKIVNISEKWDQLEWSSTNKFKLDKARYFNKYFYADFQLLFSSIGKIKASPFQKYNSLDTSIKLFIGQIPSSLIPLLIGQTLTKNENIKIEQNSVDFLKPSIIDSQEQLLNKDIFPFINKAFNMKLFSLSDLSNRILRKSIGLDESDSPVPEGVYLIKDDLGLGGIFVQGDLDELLLSIDGQSQILSFAQQDKNWILKYSLEETQTKFLSPQDEINFNLIPRGIIIVNGSIHSLGGGISNGLEKPILSTEETPSLMDGIQLTIVSPDKISIRSHLLHQKIERRNKIPYLKYSKSQLNLLTSGMGILDNLVHDGQITISDKSPDVLNIQAFLSATGQGIQIQGQDKRINLVGSLQASKIQLGDTRMHIFPDRRMLLQHDLLNNIPLTGKPVLMPIGMKINSWIEDET